MFFRRGLLVHPEEFDEELIRQMCQAGLNVLGLHPAGGKLAHESLETAIRLHAVPAIQARIDMARDRNISVEYEAHALRWLVPRSLFCMVPDWFRMNERGCRIPDFHLCVSNPEALMYLETRSEALARQLWTGAHRWSFWPDDVQGVGCCCSECRKLSLSDQALILANAVQRGIRRADPMGCTGFLAYQDTLDTPKKIRPEDGVFLEFAPIRRDHHRPLSDEGCEQNAREIRSVRQLLSFFGRQGAQAVDYWMDNSMFSHWQKPPQPFHLDIEVLKRDAEFYDSLGFESVTSFGCYLGQDYRERYGKPPIGDFGACLQSLSG